jgi:mRNA interferase RelE/StbE
VSGYRIYIRPQALREIKDAPGYIRHRVTQAIDSLKDNPFSGKIKQLRVDEQIETIFRLRLENWRIIYRVSEQELSVDILAVRKRPPYDYGDLTQLLSE